MYHKMKLKTLLIHPDHHKVIFCFISLQSSQPDKIRCLIYLIWALTFRSGCKPEPGF